MNEPTNDFEEFEEFEFFHNLDLNNLIFEVWTKPKLVFTYLFKTNPTKYLQVLLIASALSSTFNRAMEKSIGFDSYGKGYFLGMVVFGALLTWALYYLLAWILQYFGKAFLNGSANSKKFLTVLAWSNIPNIASAFFTFFLILIYGPNALHDSFTPPSEIAGFVYIVVGLCEMALAIWSVAILVIGTMYIQKFGTGKAIGNIFLPFILIIVVFVLVFVLGDLF